MLELVYIFLFSIGFLTSENIDKAEVTEINESTFGIVITDDVGSRITVAYDKDKQTFIVQ